MIKAPNDSKGGRRAALLTVGALAAALSAGCGGDSNTGGNPDMTSAAPTFASVQTAITNKGCGAPSLCHGTGTTTMLSLGADASANYMWLSTKTGKNGPFINKDAPETSNLLVIPATAAKHGASGAAWTSSDKDYQTVLAWLRAGAPAP